MPDITGVLVHLSDRDDHRGPILHPNGRSYLIDDGDLYVYDQHGQRLAVHASMDWGWTELVYAEQDEAGPATADRTDEDADVWPYNADRAPAAAAIDTGDDLQALHGDEVVDLDSAVALYRKAQADLRAATALAQEATALAQAHHQQAASA